LLRDFYGIFRVCGLLHKHVGDALMSPWHMWWASDFACCHGGLKSLMGINNVEMTLIPLDRGRFVVVHPCLTLLLLHLVAPPQKINIVNAIKLGVFAIQGRQ